MTHPDHPVHVHLSRLHCGAICKEMGERLSLALGAQTNKLPPALLALIGRLKKQNSIFAKADIIELMTTAMRSAIATLPHPLSSERVQAVAETILRTAKDGERDPKVLERMALMELQISSS